MLTPLLFASDHAAKPATPPPAAKPAAAPPAAKPSALGEAKHAEAKPAPPAKAATPHKKAQVRHAARASGRDVVNVSDSHGGGGHGAGPQLDPDDILQELKQGNKRFVSGRSMHPRMSLARLRETSSGGQHPFACILSCADSRVPPETVFDQGVGDLFTVRVAGNVANNDEIASLDYAIEHLNVPVVVVMGHTACGAVTAVVNEDRVPTSIAQLVKHIGEAVLRTRRYNPSLKGKDLVEESVRVNVWESVEDMLRGSEMIAARVRTGMLRVAGAVYHIDTGEVEWLGSYPGSLSILR
ncbi:MAG: carbonic anhydrase [Acidobacteria bacterium]|nr:carbonic anhydrase [Acidobacteriota bacterium]